MARPAGCLKIFFAIPLLFIVFGVGLWLLGNVNRVLTHDTTEGVVIQLVAGTDSDGDTTYTPTYEYEVDGQTYTYKSKVSYGGLLVPDIGDVRTLLYNPNDPADVQVRSMFILIWLPLILIAIPILILLGMLYTTIVRRRHASEVPTQLGQATQPPWAEQTAQPPWSQPAEQPSWSPPADRSSVTAMFMGTEPSQMDDKGKVRYRVKARAEIDGVQHRFLSDWMDEDPTLYYMQHGNTVEVRINPDDPTSYEVMLPAVG